MSTPVRGQSAALAERALEDAERFAKEGDRAHAMTCIELALNLQPGDADVVTRATRIRDSVASGQSRPAPTAPRRADLAVEGDVTPAEQPVDWPVRESNFVERSRRRHTNRRLVAALTWIILLAAAVALGTVIVKPDAPENLRRYGQLSDPAVAARAALNQKDYGTVGVQATKLLSNPENAALGHVLLARAAAARKDDKQAKTHLTAVLREGNATWESLLDAGQMLGEMHENVLADSAYVLAFVRDAPSERWLEIARSFAAHGRRHAALTLLERIRSGVPSDSSAAAALARSLGAP